VTEDASAGRLYAEVLADASKFRADAEKKLKAALKGMQAEARVKVSFSTAQARTALNATLREAARDARLSAIKAKAEFNAQQVRTALNAALREAVHDAKLSAITPKVEFSPIQVRRALNDALRQVEGDVTARVKVEIDTWGAQKQVDEIGRGKVVKVDTEAKTVSIENDIERVRRSQSSRPINIPVRADADTLSRVGAALTGMLKMPVIADGAIQLAGGLFAIASSAGQAAGVLAVLPNLAGVAVQGMSALMLGFSGIGEAVKAMGKAQQAAGTQSAKSASQQAAAAEQIRSAQERLARAQEQAAERVAEARQRLARVVEEAAERTSEAERRVSQAQSDGARRVEDAERRVTDSHRTRILALQGLEAATAAAIERQQDLALALSGAALDEESAELALERAKLRLEQITGPGSTASSLDKREADLAFRQAMQRLEEVRESNEDLAQEKAESDRRGIAGSEEVLNAQERIAEATRDEVEAQRNLAEVRADVATDIAEAQRDLAEVHRDNARDIADAQADIVKAQRDGARQVADAQRDLAKAMRPATSAATGQAAAVSALATAMGKLSPAGREFAKFVKGTLEPRMRTFRNAVQQALLPHIQKAITLGMPLLDTLQKGLVDSANRVGELGVKLGRLFGSEAFNKDVSKIMKSNNRALSDFGDAGIALVKILTRVAKVAGPILLEPFAKWTKQLAESALASDKLSESRIAAFLEKSAEAAKKLGKIFINVVRGIRNIARAARPSGDTLLDDLVDASDKFVKVTGDPENQRKMKDFFDRLVPIIEKLGTFLLRVTTLLGRIQEIGGGRAMEAFLATMEIIVGLLERLFSIPGVGTVVGVLLTLAGVGLALGLVAAAIGGIVKNLGRLARFTGLSRLLGGISKGFKDMGDEAEKELPKDKRKSAALADIGDKADKTKKKSDNLGGGLDVLGDKADKNAKKSRGLAGALKKIGDTAKEAVGSLAVLSSGKGGKGGTGGKLGKAGKVAGPAALLALMFGGDISDMFGGGVAGGAASGAVTGGSIGSLFGPIGTAIGGLFGGGFGAVSGGKGNLGHAGAGSLLGLPGLLIGGFGEKIIKNTPGWAKAVRTGVDGMLGEFRRLTKDAPEIVQNGWKKVKETVPGLAGLGALPISLGNILGQGREKFSNFRKEAPKILDKAWGAVVGTVPGLAGLRTSVGGVLGNIKIDFGTFKKALPGVLGQAWKGAVNTVPGLGAITGAVGGVLAGTGKKFDDFKKSAPEILGKAWKGALGTAPSLAPLTGAVGSILTGTGKKFDDLRKSAPDLLRRGFGGVLGTPPAMSKLPEKVGAILDTARKKFEDLKTKAPQIASGGWLGVLGTVPKLKPLTAKVGEITEGVVKWFKSSISGVKTQWDKLPGITGGPIKNVVNTVYNNGLVKLWNAVADKLPGFGPLGTIKLGFARGGILPGQSSYRDGDDQLVPMRKGEGVYVSEAMKDPFERARLFAVNAAAMRGKSLKPFQGFATGGIFEGVGNFLRSAKDFFSGGLKKVLSGAINPLLDSVTSSLSGSPYGKMIAGTARHIASKAIAHILGFEDQLGGGDSKGVVAAAKRYLGRGDGTDGFRGANNNIFNRNWGFGAGTPWCANFVSTAIKDAKAGKAYKGYPTAAVYGYYSRMKKVPGDTARAGDLGVYGGPTGHINIVEKNLGKGKFQTVGGNENSLVRRAVRYGAYAILRPGAALGGIIDSKVFQEKNLGYDHDKNDLMYQLLAHLKPSMAMSVSKTLGALPKRLLNRDSGGPIYPGANVVYNGTGALEWALTPEAVEMLGGPRAVQGLNNVARLHRSSRATSEPRRAVSHQRPGGEITQNIYPQPRQSEYEIGMVAARKLGQLLR
jgi:hypothetical protein